MKMPNVKQFCTVAIAFSSLFSFETNRWFPCGSTHRIGTELKP